MRKAGGIIVLVAGIFAIFASGFTLLAGGIATGFEAESANTIVNRGWGGVVFAFLTIVLGAIALGAKGRNPGVLIIICSITGAILGGTLSCSIHGIGWNRRIAHSIAAPETEAR